MIGVCNNFLCALGLHPPTRTLTNLACPHHCPRGDRIWVLRPKVQSSQAPSNSVNLIHPAQIRSDQISSPDTYGEEQRDEGDESLRDEGDPHSDGVEEGLGDGATPVEAEANDDAGEAEGWGYVLFGERRV